MASSLIEKNTGAYHVIGMALSNLALAGDAGREIGEMEHVREQLCAGQIQAAEAVETTRRMASGASVY